jgi:membrane-associated phospholipid phosphatase
MDAHAYSTRPLARRGERARVRSRAGTGPLGPLAAALACLGALALVYVIASRVPEARLKDAALLYHATLLDTAGLERVGLFVLHLLDPGVFIFWTAAIVAVGFARGGARLALAAAAVAVLAPLSSETLKPILAHPHDSVLGAHIGGASFPSGHAAAAAALVLAGLLVAPVRMRPVLAAVGACFAAVVGALLIVLAWHMPSDVVGGYLMAGFWAALAVAMLRAAPRRRRSRA